MNTITKTRLIKYIENFSTKNENCQMKTSGSSHISTKKLDCRYSLANEYPQPMFWAEIRKLLYTHVNPSFTV